MHFYSVFMRCGPSLNDTSLVVVPDSIRHEFVLPSSASLFCRYPVLHCVKHEPCEVRMEAFEACEMLQKVEGVSMTSHCVVRVDTTNTMVPTAVLYRGHEIASFVVSVGGERRRRE